VNVCIAIATVAASAYVVWRAIRDAVEEACELHSEARVDA
jgi:hypothetical protein